MKDVCEGIGKGCLEFVMFYVVDYMVGGDFGSY